MHFTSKEQYNSFTVFMTHTFPGSPVIKNSPVNAGDKGLTPGPGRLHVLQSNKDRAPQLLSWRCRAHMPQLLSPYVPRALAPQQEKPLQGEACALQLESSPCLLQLEKVCVQQWRPSTAKTNK